VGELSAIRSLLDAAFADEEGFEEDDWEHAIGGTHFLAESAGTIIAHASVVEREIHVDGQPLRTGYVEAVATAPAYQGRGIGTALMTEVTEHIRDGFELGVLGTGRHAFYERLGWATWRGPSAVRLDDTERRTPNEDGSILVLATPASPTLDPTTRITYAWRSGDVW
jgi:aminoglycoside 2'-N-acetyltransferase I